MKKNILLFVTLSCFFIAINTVPAQTVTIGAGTSNKYVPYNPYYGYTYSQSIFNQSEIALAGDIDKIRYYFNGSHAISDNPVNIYIGHTTKSTFTSTSDWIPVSSMTLVYSGIISTTAVAGWIEIDVSNFAYNNTDNLVVAVHDNDAGFDSSTDYYYSTACTGSKSIFKYQDSPIIDPSSPSTGTLQAFRPNIQLVFVPTIPMTYISSTVTQTNNTDVNPGLANQEIIGIQVTTANSASPFSLTQFQINMNGSTNGIGDVSNIDFYSTGSSSTFATTTLFGSSAPAAGTINTNGSITLQAGTNYFWLVYDIAAGATINNYVDAECTQITMNGGIGNKIPLVTTPVGKRKIVIPPTVYLMSNTAVNTCSGVFYDSGGASSNYADGLSYTKTFCSDNGQNLRFDFTSFDVQSTWDYLKIYDGPTIASNLIGTYTIDVPTSIISSGTCLTFKFISDCCANNSGWSANISCFQKPTCGTNPVANDICASATHVNNLSGYCGNTSGTYTADQPGNLLSVFCGTIENNSWLTFTADSTAALFNVWTSACAVGDGIQIEIYRTADCNTFTSVSNCWNPFNDVNGVITATGLTVGQEYYMMIDGNNGDICNFLIGAGEGVVVLPITLSNFEVTCDNGLPKINWTTSTEINNDYFTIERSSDGHQFESIGKINGAGNNSTSLNYSFVDDSPLTTVGYYRLKQTDFDGKFDYTNIVAANCKKDDLYSSIYPNPAKEQLTFTYNNLNNDKGNMYLYVTNSLGELIIQNSYIQESFIKKTLDISNLSNGVYHVIFVSNSTREVHKLVVNK